MKKKSWLDGHLYTPYRLEMLDSPAFRCLSPWAHKILARFAFSYAAKEPNGRIQVSQKTILEWANSRSKRTIEVALKELMLLGFIEATGARTVRLTFLPTGPTPPTDEWAAVRTIAEAQSILGGKKRRPQTEAFKCAIAAGDMTLLRREPISQRKIRS